MAVTVEASTGSTAIGPFKVEFPEADLEDLRARIAATRTRGAGRSDKP
jgi:hypothetical protein